MPASAGAITNGQEDTGDAYPMVGALVGTFDGNTFPYCSGVLISSAVLLTAAHCDPGDQPACVTFDQTYTSSSPLVCGDFVAHPDYKPVGDRTPYDVAVVVFEGPVGSSFASLPTLDRLDEMRADQTIRSIVFTSVGYGSFAPEHGPGGQAYTYPDARYYSTGTYQSLGPNYLTLSQNPVKGNGGTCFGDSGGPVFFGSSTTLAGIVSTGDAVCRSTNVAQRLDTARVRDFLDDYVTLP